MFVRIKTIKGRKYAYLVHNEWTPWGSRQKVAKYLGKTHFPGRVAQDVLTLPSEFSPAVLKAVEQELLNHGFSRLDTNFINENLIVNLNEGTIRQKGRKAVLALNEGYLCDDTLQQLLSFEMLDRPDESAKKLAGLALEAGLKLSDDQFVHLFEQVKP